MCILALWFLGPQILALWFLGPRILGPRILGPQILGPRILGPRILGPRISATEWRHCRFHEVKLNGGTATSVTELRDLLKGAVPTPEFLTVNIP